MGLKKELLPAAIKSLRSHLGEFFHYNPKLESIALTAEQVDSWFFGQGKAWTMCLVSYFEELGIIAKSNRA